MTVNKFLGVIVSRAINSEASQWLQSNEVTDWCDRMRQRDVEREREEILEKMLRVQAPVIKN